MEPIIKCTGNGVQEDQLCQETQIKCLLLRTMEPVWTRLVGRIVELLSSLSSSSPDCEARSLYVLEGLRLWQSLISIRANINFVESRNFAANLSACVHALQVSFLFRSSGLQFFVPFPPNFMHKS